MAVTPVGVSAFATTTASTTLTISLTSGDFATNPIQANDIILLLLGNGEDSPQPSITTPPSGYTARGTLKFTDYGPGGISQAPLYWKIAGSSESNPSVTWNTGDSNGGGIWGLAVAYRGVLTSDPFDLSAVSEGENAAASTFTPPSVTTLTAESMVVSFVTTSDDNSLALNTAQSFTLRAGGASYSTTAGSDSSFGVADRLVASAGSVTMPTWEQTANASDRWAYQTIALKAGSVNGTATPGVIAKSASMYAPTISASGYGLAQLVSKAASLYGATGIAQVVAAVGVINKEAFLDEAGAAGDAVAMTTMLPDGDGTITSLTKSGGTTFAENIDELGTAPNLNDYVANSAATATGFFTLAATPSDFTSMEEIFIECSFEEV